MAVNSQTTCTTNQSLNDNTLQLKQSTSRGIKSHFVGKLEKPEILTQLSYNSQVHSYVNNKVAI